MEKMQGVCVCAHVRVYMCVCVHMWTHTVEYYSALKKNKIMTFAATWMDLEMIILSEVRQRNTDTTQYHLHVKSKVEHKCTHLQNRNRLTDIDDKLVVPEGKAGYGRDGLGVWD